MKSNNIWTILMILLLGGTSVSLAACAEDGEIAPPPAEEGIEIEEDTETPEGIETEEEETEEETTEGEGQE
ncbi:hypothetical protein Cyast_1705 [Cyanobacterium stanieri PCC 7202]|uniref:Uncharacterized protein n=1 Tax=Cyanobacterium stanieri (strain ATCC 29140 / PCC 7202) TaxID=292563 RepID=K9YMG8_CYASC|nr:hypothetical protein Cyast_1705 [Cyanobacterium stanieri PCC 7202]